MFTGVGFTAKIWVKGMMLTMVVTLYRQSISNSVMSCVVKPPKTHFLPWNLHKLDTSPYYFLVYGMFSGTIYCLFSPIISPFEMGNLYRTSQ